MSPTLTTVIDGDLILIIVWSVVFINLHFAFAFAFLPTTWDTTVSVYLILFLPTSFPSAHPLHLFL